MRLRDGRPARGAGNGASNCPVPQETRANDPADATRGAGNGATDNPPPQADPPGDPAEVCPVPHGTPRRQLLRRAAATGAAGLVTATATAAAPPPADGTHPRPTPFHGPHQPGIVQTPARRTTLTAFDVLAPNRRELADLLRTLTERSRALALPDGPITDPGIAGPPADDGVLGPDPRAPGPLITVGLGASLFDAHRYGLADRRPRHLAAMPVFPDDDLDPAQCHGDLSVQISAADEDTVAHAVREIARATRGAMQIRWQLDGFRSPPRPSGTPRNLMGFKDGTSNPDPDDPAAMRGLVWAGSGEPAWARGGTYAVYRLIRMLVEFWDRIGISEQEQIIGRARDTGAPLDGDRESDPPRFKQDPVGVTTPLTSHIRLANPRTEAADRTRILRVSHNYSRGFDRTGNLDQGLLFTCYQRDPERQFAAIQRRLAGEPLTDYISPFGGGYFFVPPGVRNRADFLARELVTT